MCLHATGDNGFHLAATQSPCESQLLILTTFTITQGNLILTSSHFSPLYSYTTYIISTHFCNIIIVLLTDSFWVALS